MKTLTLSAPTSWPDKRNTSNLHGVAILSSMVSLCFLLHTGCMRLFYAVVFVSESKIGQMDSMAFTASCTKYTAFAHFTRGPGLHKGRVLDASSQILV